MEKVLVFGAGARGRELCRMLRNPAIKKSLGEIEIKLFADNKMPSGLYVEGIKVISPDDINQCPDIDSILISSSNIVDEIAEELNNLGIKIPVYLVPDYVYEFKWGNKMPPFCLIDITKPRMSYLECKIVDHCNLNCKGCSWVSNISQNKNVDILDFERDLKALKGLFFGIKQLKLFGGEPLLHPQLKEFIIKSREYFPDAQIVVHSNGLLVPRMSAELLEVMQKLDIHFKFSLYPVTGKVKRQIERRLDSAAVKYSFTPPFYEFRKIINIRGDYDPKKIYRFCDECINLVDGTLSCGMGYMMQTLEKTFDVQICEDKWQHCIDIHNTEYSGWEINKILNSPYNLCAYCSLMNLYDYDEEDMFHWGVGDGNPCLEEFITNRERS